jgi:hypothetical protein
LKSSPLRAWSCFARNCIEPGRIYTLRRLGECVFRLPQVSMQVSVFVIDEPVSMSMCHTDSIFDTIVIAMHCIFTAANGIVVTMHHVATTTNGVAMSIHLIVTTVNDIIVSSDHIAAASNSAGGNTQGCIADDERTIRVHREKEEEKKKNELLATKNFFPRFPSVSFLLSHKVSSSLFKAIVIEQ